LHRHATSLALYVKQYTLLGIGSTKLSIIRATVFAKDNAANLALRDYKIF